MSDVEKRLSTIFCAVPAFMRVEPAITSGPVSTTMRWRATRKQRRLGIVGERDGHGARGTRRPQHADGERRGAARRDADHDVIGADPGVGDGARAFGLVVLGAFHALHQGAETAGHDEDQPVGGPVEGRRQLASVLHADAPGGARPGIDQPAAALQRRHRIVDRRGDGLERAAHGSGRRELALVHGLDHLGGGPRIEIDIARADVLGRHSLSWLPTHTLRAAVPPPGRARGRQARRRPHRPALGDSRRCTSAASHGSMDDASPPTRAMRGAPRSTRQRTSSSIRSAASRNILPATAIAVVRVPHDEGREGRVVGRRCAIHPGHGLERVVAEARHHLAREVRRGHAPVARPQCQPDRLQAEIGAAAFIGNRKAVAADPDLAAVDHAQCRRCRCRRSRCRRRGRHARRCRRWWRHRHSGRSGTGAGAPSTVRARPCGPIRPGRPPRRWRPGRRRKDRLRRARHGTPSPPPPSIDRCPSRTAAGPPVPVPSTRPSPSSMRARQPVPPPSTPMTRPRSLISSLPLGLRGCRLTLACRADHPAR